MNRAERRQRMKEYAKDRNAEKCPLCNKKSLFVTIPAEDYLCDVRCELCGGIVLKDCRYLVPMVYVSLKGIKETEQKLVNYESTKNDVERKEDEGK